MKIILWDIKSAKLIHSYLGHKRPIFVMAFSPDSKKFLATSGMGLDKVIRLWDVETGQEIYQFDFPSSIKFINFSSDGRYVVLSGEDNIIRLWNIEKKEQLEAFQGHEHPASKVIFSSDNQQLISISIDKTIRRWDINFAK